MDDEWFCKGCADGAGLGITATFCGCSRCSVCVENPDAPCFERGDLCVDGGVAERISDNVDHVPFAVNAGVIDEWCQVADVVPAHFKDVVFGDVFHGGDVAHACGSCLESFEFFQVCDCPDVADFCAPDVKEFQFFQVDEWCYVGEVFVVVEVEVL